MCMCVSIYVYIMPIFIKTCEKISSTDTSIKQIWMTCGYITINNKKKKKKKFFYSGGQ